MTGYAQRRPPEAVGKLYGTPVPEELPWIGSIVEFANKDWGIVACYQYYRPRQLTFPVRMANGQVRLFMACDVTVVESIDDRRYNLKADKSSPKDRIPRQRAATPSWAQPIMIMDTPLIGSALDAPVVT